MRPVVVLELENRDVAIRGSAGEEATDFVGRPSDEVYTGVVESNFVDLLPLVRGFFPDEDLAVVGGGCEYVAVLGVSLFKEGQYTCPLWYWGMEKLTHATHQTAPSCLRSVPLVRNEGSERGDLPLQCLNQSV